MMGTGSRKQAINQFCRDCIVDDTPGNGSWRRQVAECTAYNCALFPFRPLPIGYDSKESCSLLRAPELAEKDLIITVRSLG